MTSSIPRDYKYSSYKHLINRFMLHGPQFFLSKEISIVRRVFWVTCFVTVFAIFVTNLKHDLSKYISLDRSNIDIIEYAENLTFPSITVCPINQFKLKDISGTVIDRISKQHGLPISSRWTDPGFDVSGEELRQAILNNSFTIEDLLYQCDFIAQTTHNPFLEAKDCGTHKFDTVISPHGEVCFTLTAKKHNVPFIATHPGLNHGYNLKFDLNVYNSLAIYPYNGLKIMLHEENEPPLFAKVHFVITSGLYYYVEMKREEIINSQFDDSSKLSELHDQCNNTKKKLEHFEHYNQKSCLLELLTNFVAEKCGCRQPYMPDNGMPLCSLKTSINCVFPTEEQFDVHNQRKLCPDDCIEKRIDVQITDTRFLHNPPVGISLPPLDFLNVPHLSNLQGNQSWKLLDEYIEDNMVSVMFYFGEIAKTIKMRGNLLYTLDNLIGDTAFFLKAMMGASSLTLYRLLELTVLVIYYKLIKNIFFRQNPMEKYVQLEMDSVPQNQQQENIDEKNDEEIAGSSK